MPRKYMFGTRRYLGGSFMQFGDTFMDDGIQMCGTTTRPTRVRGFEVPAGSQVWKVYDDNTYNVTAPSAVTLYGHSLPAQSTIEFPERSIVYALGAFGSENTGDRMGILLLFLAVILLPISYALATWRHARWALVTVEAPTQIGGLLAMPNRQVEIAWSGQVRYFEPPWNKPSPSSGTASETD